MSSLPYHCPKLSGDYLRAPCEGNLARGKEWREKFPHALKPYPLDYCEQCGGKELVARESLPKKTENFDKERQMPPAVRFKNEAEFEKIMNQGKMPTAPVPAKGQFCKNHPTILSKQDKNGCFMGLCRECLVARGKASKGKPRGGKDKMPPAVARDLSQGTSAVAPVCQISPTPALINVQTEVVPAPPPEETSMGPGLLLDFTDYPELWEKLQRNALASCRTPALQAIYFIKVYEA